MRKASMLLVSLLMLMPIGGSVSTAAANALHLPPVSPLAQWWLDPPDLAIVSACAAVLALTASLRWR